MNVDIKFEHITSSPNGFFVDCGSHNGKYLSKTKRLEDKGWDGIAVDANPTLCDEYCTNRSTKCYNYALSDVDNIDVKLHLYPGNRNLARSSLDVNKLLIEYKDITEADLEHITCKTITLNTLFSRNKIKNIDFLKIDLEGLDARVLLDLSLHKYNIQMICYEVLGFFACREEYLKLEKKLIKHGYKKLLDLDKSSKYFEEKDVVWSKLSDYK